MGMYCHQHHSTQHTVLNLGMLMQRSILTDLHTAKVVLNQCARRVPFLLRQQHLTLAPH